MVVNGLPLCSYRELAKHLEKIKKAGDDRTDGWNDSVTLVASCNLAFGGDIATAMREMAVVGKGSRCRKFIYAVSISPNCEPGDDFADDEAEQVADKLLSELGFSDAHQWFLVRHEKGGRTHFHLLANRVHPETLKAVQLSWNYIRHEKVARWAEDRFGLRPVPGVFTGRRREKGRYVEPRPIAKMSTIEHQQSLRTSLSVDVVAAVLTTVWNAARNGIEFAERLAKEGYQLVRGDRRDLVIVDPEGGVHSPARRLGIRVAHFREKTRDIKSSEIASLAELRKNSGNGDRARPQPRI